MLYHQGSAFRVRRPLGVVDPVSERLSFVVPGPTGGMFWQHGSHRLRGDDLILYAVWTRAGHDRPLAQEIVHRRLERGRVGGQPLDVRPGGSA